MDVDEEDLVPEITKKHFEESMKFARRYVLIILLGEMIIGPGRCYHITFFKHILHAFSLISGF